MLYFEWDDEKAAKNLSDHGVSFGAARSALLDPFAIEETDQIADGELRLLTVGMADSQLVVLVSHTNRDEVEGHEIARIIHARKASPGERRNYEQNRSSIGGYSIDR
jgi:uncharacterized DUF497 family protein